MKKPKSSTKKKSATGSSKLRGAHNRSQVERLFGICAAIQERTHYDDRITCEYLAEKFEVSKRTIFRDIEFLRDRLGVGIEFDPKESSFTLPDSFRNLPPIDLRNDDYLTLSFLGKFLDQYSGTEIGETMRNSFRRVLGLLLGTRHRDKFSQSILFRVEEKPGASTLSEMKIFNILHASIERKTEVLFDYQPTKGAASSRRVCPLLLLANKGRWYLYGQDREKNGLRVFNFSRIQNLEYTKKSFETGEFPDPKEYLQKSFGVGISTDAECEVVIEFEAEVVRRLKETIWHPKQSIEDLPDGKARLVLRLNTYVDLKPWILSWGPYARIVSPDFLADQIASSAKRMAARYAEE